MATYTSGGEESTEIEWAFSLWQLRNHCIHSHHWDSPYVDAETCTSWVRFTSRLWGRKLGAQIRSVLVGSSSPGGAQPLGDRSLPGLVTAWLVSVPALPGPQPPLEDEQMPLSHSISTLPHPPIHAFCRKPLPGSLRAAVLSSLPPSQFKASGWLHDPCSPHL